MLCFSYPSMLRWRHPPFRGALRRAASTNIHGTGGAANHLPGDASPKEARESPLPAVGHEDEIRLRLPDLPEDLASGIPDPGEGLRRDLQEPEAGRDPSQIKDRIVRNVAGAERHRLVEGLDSQDVDRRSGPPSHLDRHRDD